MKILDAAYSSIIILVQLLLLALFPSLVMCDEERMMTTAMRTRTLMRSLQTTTTMTCSDDEIAECAALNALCSSTTTTTTTSSSCTTCQDGFVSLQQQDNGLTDVAVGDNCLNIDTNLTLEAYQDVFQPLFFFDETVVSKAERLVRLIQMARFISESNARNIHHDDGESYVLSLNEYSAETPEERLKRTGYIPDDDGSEDAEPIVPEWTASSSSSSSDGSLPDAIDWVQEGVVTITKQQLFCGCCWSVAAVGAVEAKAEIDRRKNNGGPTADDGPQENYSFQQMISCDTDNNGCNGGSTVGAMIYAHENDFGGLASYRDYPYEDRFGETTETCALDDDGSTLSPAIQPPEARMVLQRRKGSSDGFADRLEKMKRALNEQPVAVVMRASCDLFSAYSRGVLTDDGDCACDKSTCLDHAILMVGYNDTHSPPYLLVKNSWGSLWGEGGYFRIAQIEKGDYGLFGILAEGVMPSTNEEFDEAKGPLKFWQILLICFAGALVVGIICFGLEYAWTQYRNRDQGRGGEAEENGDGDNAGTQQPDEAPLGDDGKGE